MRQLEPKKVTIAKTDFYIYPFSAFKSSNLSAEVASIIGPLLSVVLPLKSDNGGDVLDMDIEKASPAIIKAFESIDGNKVEGLLKKLLIKEKNIAVKYKNEDGELEQEYLDEDLANEIFCGEVQNMFLLAYKVIEVNFGGFFKKLPSLFGKEETTKITMSKNTASSMEVNSAN